MMRLVPSQVAAQPFSQKVVLGGAGESKKKEEGVKPPKPTPVYTHTVPFETLRSDLFSNRLHNPLGENRFVVIGDAGTGDEGQYAIGERMSELHRMAPFNTVLSLGDNVYKYGQPESFEDRIYKPYKPLYDQNVRFFPVLGNHDVKQGFSSAQLDYSGVPPCYNFKLGSKGQEVEFFAIDTTVLTPGGYGCYKNNPLLAEKKAEIQMAWLEKALTQSTASMKVVYGHYPMYSEGGLVNEKRATVQQAMEEKLAPLFQRYGVAAYMAGHEHHYEKPKNVNGVYYLVSGAAGKADKPHKGVPESESVQKIPHFMAFEIKPEGLVYQAISDKNRVFDSGLIPRKPVGMQRALTKMAPWTSESGFEEEKGSRKLRTLSVRRHENQPAPELEHSGMRRRTSRLQLAQPKKDEVAIPITPSSPRETLRPLSPPPVSPPKSCWSIIANAGTRLITTALNYGLGRSASKPSCSPLDTPNQEDCLV